jgi:hypothetical protein
VIREEKRYNEQAHNFHHLRYYAIQQEDIPQEKSTKEIVQIHDSRKAEYNCAYRQFPQTVQLIDLNARHSFSKGSTCSMIKCCAKFNMHGTKDRVINPNMVSQLCPRCNAIKTWSYVITCPSTHRFIKEWIEDIRMKLKKEDSRNENKADINRMITDIKQFLYGDDPSQTNQALIGYKSLFRGFIVRNWSGVQDSNRYEDLNKIIVKHCVYYYQK